MDANPKRRWFRYSLRTLLVFVTLASAGFGWLGYKVRQAKRQQDTILAIMKLGGTVIYDYEYEGAPLPGPKWLRDLIGVDFFAAPYAVDFVRFGPVDVER